MDNQSPSAAQTDGIFDVEARKIFAASNTCTAAFLLLIAFFASATRYRVWNTNWILEKVLELADHPLYLLLAYTSNYLVMAPYHNELYLIWQVVLSIAYDNVITISAGSAPSTNGLLREYVLLLLAASSGLSFFGNREYYFIRPLLLLYLFLLVKFTFRVVAHKFLGRAYGLNNTRLLTDYMKVEHKLTENETIDPVSMKGYKYIVLGEWKIDAKIHGPKYDPQIALPDDVVTVDRTWNCQIRLLHPSIDADNRVKEVCLSFAFFKLLKRRFFYYPAAEAALEKTRKLVFDGLLSHDKDAVFRIVGMEMGFLRDYFYTRYPAIFALGFPVFNVIVLIGMLGASIWISVKTFHHTYDDHVNNYLWSKHHHRNIDYTITNILLIMVIVMESLETLFYVFSDWAKVMLICRHVKTQILHPHCFLDKVIAVLCRGTFNRSLNNTIGQYSLLKNYKKYNPSRSNKSCCKPTWGYSPLGVAPKGMQRNKSEIVSPQVKEAILSSLKMMKVTGLTNGVSSLSMNKVDGDLAWTCDLQSEYHTLMVWHIATCLCGIRPTEEGGDRNSIEPHHLVATHLSNYCAYLMVFVPDMLPESFFSVKLLFREILQETIEFFQGASNHQDEYIYNTMMQFKCPNKDHHKTQFGCSPHQDHSVINMGVMLGKYLMQKPDDLRWRIMADFWSELIIFLAPSGKSSEHMKMLRSGGEFITHLWALLYHAGIADTPTTRGGNVP